MFIKAAILFLATVAILGPAAHASDPMPGWSNRWVANVWNTYCELKLDYAIPYRSDSDRRGIFAGRTIDRLFARFATSTRTHYGLIPEEELFKVRFELHFYGEGGDLAAENDRVVSARIGEFEMSPPEKSDFWIAVFTLDEDDTSSLLQQFRDNQRVELVVRFSDGEERRSMIYPSGDRDFHVWAAMFRTCIQENIGARY